MLALNFTGITELAFSKRCNFLNCLSDYPSDLSFMQTCDSESLPHALLLQIFFEVSWLPRILFLPPSLFFFFKKGFSFSKTLYHALAFMYLTGHEVMRALPFTSAGRRIEVLE